MLVRERAALTLDQDSAVLGWKGVSHLAPMLCYAAPGLTTLIGYLNHLVFASVPDCTRNCWQKSHSNNITDSIGQQGRNYKFLHFFPGHGVF